MASVHSSISLYILLEHIANKNLFLITQLVKKKAQRRLNINTWQCFLNSYLWKYLKTTCFFHFTTQLYTSLCWSIEENPCKNISYRCKVRESEKVQEVLIILWCFVCFFLLLVFNWSRQTTLSPTKAFKNRSKDYWSPL